MKLKLLFFLICLTLGSLNGQGDPAFAKEIKKHRKHYKKDFLKEDRSPLEKQDLKYLRFFDANKKFQVTCHFEETPDSKPFELATYSGMTKPYRKYGNLTFEIDGQKYQLAVYQSLRLIKIPAYKDYLFIPFKDPTNETTTYGGGRYMDIKKTDIKENKLILDFNKAYNPWCAYSDGYNCPIPPLDNHLEVAINAGEQNFAKEKKKK